ncbi:MAG: hypothetical protein OXJ90_00595 [Spirochaetaceae bacterium]|nr:hypothetical protein [Spirochaetaceae bacterium]
MILLVVLIPVIEAWGSGEADFTPPCPECYAPPRQEWPFEGGSGLEALRELEEVLETGDCDFFGSLRTGERIEAELSTHVEQNLGFWAFGLDYLTIEGQKDGREVWFWSREASDHSLIVADLGMPAGDYRIVVGSVLNGGRFCLKWLSSVAWKDGDSRLRWR